MYKYLCAACGHEGDAATINSRGELRCESCYALLTEAMVLHPEQVKAKSPGLAPAKPIKRAKPDKPAKSKRGKK